MIVIDAHATTGLLDGQWFGPERLVEQMDESRVTAAVMSPDHGELAVHHEDGERRLRAACERYPGRLLRFASANPWWGDGAVRHVTAALDAGAVAIKVDPARQGCQPIDDVVAPVIAVAAEYGVPVYVHSGTPVACTPFQIAVLARRFPETPFILGRGGKTDFKSDVPHALRATQNLYGDTAHDFPQTGLKMQLAAAGASRVVFSSDWPYSHYASEVGRVLEIEAGYDVVAALLGDNLRRMLPKRAQSAIEQAAR